jgi:endo-alpha-1,4-polygalactosaminidase (GH114 family)
MGAPGRSALTIRLRAARCGGAPRLVVVVDGRPALSRRIDSRRWTSWRVPRPLPPGRHTIRLRIANPHRRAHCRRALRVDRLALGVASRPPPSKPPPRRPGVWVPTPRTTWQWQLTTPVDQSVHAAMFDIDLFDNPAGVVGSLHARGRRVICYMSAGSIEPGRPDTGEFPAAIIGQPLDGWPDEHWLDIRRLDLLGSILKRRLDLCKAKGFDGVEPDNLDGYANRTGFPLTEADQLRFNRFIAKAAHARGLSIGLKNDLEQADTLEPDFDWALSEQCFQYDECELLAPFTRAGKAVFVAEYDLDTARFCPQARAAGVMAMRKRLALDAWREPC